MEKQSTQGKKRAQMRVDGGNFGGLVVLGGALTVAGLIAVSAIIGRRGKRGDDATKKKHRTTKFKEDASIGDLQAAPQPPSAAASQQNQCCTGTGGLAEICETQMVDSCEKEVSKPVIIEGNAEYSPGTDLKEESALSYDQVENVIEEETTEFADKMNSEDVLIQEKELEEEKEQLRQEDEDDEEETTTTKVDDQKTSEDVSSVLSIQEKEKKEEEEQQQQADEDRDLDGVKEVNAGGTGSTSTEAISPAESMNALSLETPWEEGNLKPIVRSYETTDSTSMSGRLMRRSWSILVLLAMGLLLFNHLSSSGRHLLHLDNSLVQ